MQAWDNFLTLQEKELGNETIHKWLRPLKVIRFDACNLYLEAKDSFQILWFEEHMRQKAQLRLFNNNNKRIKVHLSVSNAAGPSSNSKLIRGKKGKDFKDNKSISIPGFALNFDELDPNCSFKNLVISENNQLGYTLLSEICGENPAPKPGAKTEIGAFNPIYLYGITGTGKTHLLTATAHSLRSKGLNVIYTHAETFTEHVVTSIRAGAMSTFRQAYRNIDVLIVDDVHVFSRKGATQEEFFHTFNTLHLAGKQIILSANCSPQELQLIEPRLVSRFEWGIVVPLDPISKEEIKLVLQNKAAAFNYELNQKVTEFLLETFTSSTKALTRAMEALILRTHLNPQSGHLTPTSITVPMAKHSLADLIHEEEQSAITPHKIILSVAEFYGIRSEDVLGKAQTRECVLPRQIAMFLCRDKLNMSFTKIGDLFSRDHSTVMSSVKQIQKGMGSAEKDIGSSLTKILKKLYV